MALTARQSRFYVYTVDVWRVATPSAGLDFGHYQLVSSGVACLYSGSRVVAGIGQLGRATDSDALELDRFGFELDVDVRDTDVLHMVGAPNGSPDVGRWFAIHGAPQRQGWRANRLRVLAKGCLQPVGAT